MNIYNQQSITSQSGCGSIKNLMSAQEKVVDIGKIQSPKLITETGLLACHSLPDGKRRKIRYLSEGYSVYSIVSGQTTQRDINRMVSQCFSSICENYYKRCNLLETLIESDYSADDAFMKTMNSGPMYSTDCYQFVKDYMKKFGNESLVENTVLSKVENIMNGRCPPMDIYKQRPFMDVLGPYSYRIARGVKATAVLSALKYKFSIIECNMAYEIAYYDAILLLVGKENFNMIFGENKEKPFKISNDADDERTAIEFLLSVAVSHINNDATQRHLPPQTVQEGSVYYFRNHKDYIIKHPMGVDQGLNVMLVNKIEKCLYFTGFGLPGDGLIPQEINQEMVESFNHRGSDVIEEGLCEMYLTALDKKRARELRNKIITLDEFYANKGGWSKSCVEYLDIKKIKKHLGSLSIVAAQEMVDNVSRNPITRKRKRSTGCVDKYSK